ncbi:MAG: DUF2584 family protein [Oscillatoriales cyanobacterium]|nr:MAG: DUF2584 family protein [Oscillatoriales cyanobacterium]
MGMPCEVNSILKLTQSQGYPEALAVGVRIKAEKAGYRILPIDVPILLVDGDWMAWADVTIETLTWAGGVTHLEGTIGRVYDAPVSCQA